MFLLGYQYAGSLLFEHLVSLHDLLPCNCHSNFCVNSVEAITNVQSAGTRYAAKCLHRETRCIKVGWGGGQLCSNTDLSFNDASTMINACLSEVCVASWVNSSIFRGRYIYEDLLASICAFCFPWQHWGASVTSWETHEVNIHRRQSVYGPWFKFHCIRKQKPDTLARKPKKPW